MVVEAIDNAFESGYGSLFGKTFDSTDVGFLLISGKSSPTLNN